MGGFDQILWDQVPFDGDAEPEEAAVSAGEILAALYPRLHAAGASDLIWWSKLELLDWLDLALKALARRAGMFVKRTQTATAAAAATYALPPDHLSTIQVSLAGTPLRPASVHELAARDEGYETTAADATHPVTHWYEDTIGLASIGVARVPIAVEQLTLIHHHTLPAPGADDSLLAIPKAAAAFLEDAVLSEAYGRESDVRMPEVAAFLGREIELFAQVFEEYWGAAQ
jgi:hypothetical protein